MIELATRRLELTQLSEQDAEFVLGMLNEPSFVRYIGDRGVRSLEDARRYVRDGPMTGYERHGYGLLRVALKSGGTSIGMCGVLKRDTLPDPDLGFSFLPAWWSQGYAFEAASAAMHHAREVLGLGRILAVTTHDNGPSMRLLGKLGFRFECMTRMGDDPTELRLFISEP